MKSVLRMIIKQKILEFRHEKMMGIELIPFDITPIVNFAWMGSFQVVKNNKKAIYERGWNPLNRMLLLHPELRCDMTENDVQWEVDSDLFSNITFNNHNNIFDKKKTKRARADRATMRSNNNNNINTNSTDEEHLEQLDFSSGLPHHFLKKIVKSVDFENARDKILADKKEGECLTERLNKVPKMTAASLINSGQTHVLGEPVFKYVQNKVSIKREERDCKQNDDIMATRKVRRDADSAIVRNKGKVLKKWTLQDLKLIIKPEKTKNDGAMPTKKADLVELYRTCMERQGRVLVDDMPNVPYVDGEVPETAGEGESETINDSSKKEI